MGKSTSTKLIRYTAFGMQCGRAIMQRSFSIPLSQDQNAPWYLPLGGVEMI